jgi:Integrase core domain.
MRRGRPRQEIILSVSEIDELKRLVRKRTVGKSLALRSQIILLCGEGLADNEVASKLNVCGRTVGQWRKRFLEMGLAGLSDAPKPGGPRSIKDEDVERVIKLTLESMPKDATHWSTRSMARASGMSQSSISRIWRAFSLKPHKSETFKLSTDPFFIEKVRDVVGLYLNPPHKAVVFCVDEKSQIQALDRTQPLLPMRPGQVERRTHDYKRYGTTTLFAALDAVSGKLLGRCFPRHRSEEFKKFLIEIDRNVPIDLDIHIVLDNYGTHKTQLIQKWLVKRPRFHLHFIPTSSSWLNLVERWFAELTNKQIKRGVHRSVKSLEEAINTYIRINNENPTPFVWVKTADQIIESVGRFCDHILDSGY